MPPSPRQSPLDIAAATLDRGLRRRLTHDLRGAIGRGELAVHYQPRLRLADGRRVGAEALLRWRHARHGEVAPGAFIPLAEGSDLIVALGGWVLQRATADAVARPDLGRVSVNVSARQVLSGALPDQVEHALRSSGLPAERLELELTETLALQEGPEAAGTLRRLRDRGVSLALDDFGTGYASLGRMRRLPFNTLKLDHSLIADLPGPAPDLAVLRALRDLGRAMGLHLVAEGVERDAQARLLVELGFDEAQGFLFGRPVPLALLCDGIEAGLAAPGKTPTLACACPRPDSHFPHSLTSVPASLA